MLACPKSADPVFFSFSCVCLFFFALELIIQVLAKKDYRFSFYFWLDFIAMLSLIPDIGWIWDPMTGQDDDDGGGKGQDQLQNAGKASRAGTKAGRVIRIIRVVRLIRIVKLYKNAQNQLELKKKAKELRDARKGSATELNHLPSMNKKAVLPEKSKQIQPVNQQFNDKITSNAQAQQNNNINQQNDQQSDENQSNQNQNQQQSEENKGIETQNATVPLETEEDQITFPQETRVSKKLFDLTTRKVIMIVLILLFLLPLFEVNLYYSAQTSFDFSVDQLYRYELLTSRDVFDQVWNLILREHDDDYRYPCIYLYSENYNIEYAKEDLDVEDLRTAEKHYSSNDDIVGVFDLREDTRLAAGLNMCRTVFVCIVLVLAALFFNNDTNTLVLVPIERMMERVKRIAKNPIAASQKQDDATDILALEAQADNQKNNRCSCCGQKRNEEEAQYETAILENTIIKIGVLLALGFGEAGANVIAQNMEKGDGDVNPMLEGQKMIAIFGFCDIRQFTDTTEVLMEKVMLFVNEIAEITHGIVHKYGGAANKNIGDAFLLVWKFKDQDIVVENENELALKQNSQQVKDTCDCALISFLKIIAKINKHPKILKYRDNAKLNERMEGYKVKMGFGLHVGWAIEGAIGSVYKIDASYLSPNVNMSSRLEAATKQYGVPLLVSGPLVKQMNKEVADICREIDKVTVKGSEDPIELFTVDLDISTLQPSEPKDRVSSKEHYSEKRNELKQDLESGTKKTITIIQKSESIKKMRKFVTTAFTETWKEGYRFYREGLWVEAKEKFELVKNLVPDDGPCQTLYQFIGEYKYLKPSEWKGHRALTEK